MSPHFSGLFCTIRGARGRAADGGNRSCCGQPQIFPLLLLFFTKTDCDLSLICFPRGLPSSKRNNKPGRLWNKAGRRNRRVGKTHRGADHDTLLGLSG